MISRSQKKALDKYKEIRGTLTKKTRFLGKYVFTVSDVDDTAKVYVGKGLYNDKLYVIGAKLTVGHIGRKLINIRPGIQANSDE